MNAPPAIRGVANQRGATAVVVALLITMLAAFTALVVNVGHVMAVRAQLQNATDAAALAAARELDGTVSGLGASRVAAADFAARHLTDRGQQVIVDPGNDVELGHWDETLPRSDAFTPVTETTTTALEQINAARVRAGREAARSNPVATFFQGLFSKGSTDVRAESIAVRGGPRSDGCPIPIVFADCMVRRADGTLKCDDPLVFNSDGLDNIGFTNLIADPSVNTDILQLILQGQCRPVHVGDPIGVSNGSNISPLVSFIQPLIGRRVSAPIVDLGECPVQFNEHPEGARIEGFASFTILAVQGGANKSLTVALDCGEILEQPVGGGGPNFGTLASEPRLVR